MRAPLPGTVGLRILVACCFFITIAGAQNVSMGSAHGSVVKLRDIPERLAKAAMASR